MVANQQQHCIPEVASLFSTADDDNNELTNKSTIAWSRIIKPFAPHLSDYLADGGTERFRPRLEWLNAAATTVSSRANSSGRRKRSRHQFNESSHEAAAALPILQHRRAAAAAPQIHAALQVHFQQHHQQAHFQQQQQAAEDPALLHAPNNGLLPDNAFADFLVAALVEPSADEAEEEQLVEPAIAAVAAAVIAPNQSQGRRSSSFSTRSLDQNNNNSSSNNNAITFGKDKDSALHMAIRERKNDAALELIQLGAPVSAENSKRVTPLILAAQKGLLEVVKSLLALGANPLSATLTGTTALLQASHFGHVAVVTLLLQHGAMMEMANYKNTTPLMRASQEGHRPVVQLMLARGARVNRRNNEHMSALMLASQRGHAPTVQLLLDHEADVDAMTTQRSTSLMLASKREHTEVVKVLVTAGCELQMKDTRGRTARDVATRSNFKGLLKLLEPPKQVELMQRKSRVERNYFMSKMWSLLQQDRASVHFSGRDMSIHQVFGHEEAGTVHRTDSSLALIRTMKLPALMVEHIASYMPLPNLWSERLMLITRRCGVDPDAAISCALDLIDEVLEEGGFLDACRIADVTPPTHFNTWEDWRSWGFKHNNLDAIPSTTGRVNALTATFPGMPKIQFGTVSPMPLPMNTRDWRRGVCFLQILAHRSPLLQRVLVEPPFCVPPSVIDQLVTVSDIQSLSRRMGSRGAQFEASVAIELVMLASSVVSWYNREMRCDGQMIEAAAIQQQEDEHEEE